MNKQINLQTMSLLLMLFIILIFSKYNRCPSFLAYHQQCIISSSAYQNYSHSLHHGCSFFYFLFYTQ